MPLPEFANGMHHDRIYDVNARVDPEYLSFAPDTELRQNYLRRDGSEGKQFLGNYFKGKMQNRQPSSLLPFAIQHAKPLTDLKERTAMVKCFEDAPTNLGVARVERHETEFEPTQPRYLFADTGGGRRAETQRGFLCTMYEECKQNRQPAFLS